MVREINPESFVELVDAFRVVSAKPGSTERLQPPAYEAAVRALRAGARKLVAASALLNEWSPQIRITLGVAPCVVRKEKDNRQMCA